MGLSSLKNAPPAEIRNELAALLYLALLDDLVFNNSVRNDLAELTRERIAWFATASDGEIKARGPKLLEANQPVKRSVLSRLPFKGSWRKTCNEFMDKCFSREFTLAHGLPFRWIDSHFNVGKLSGFVTDLPLHARIGFGPNKHSASVEEDTLLSDATLFLEKARSLHERLLQEIKTLKKTNPKAKPAQMNSLNLNVCTYARISLFTFFAFTECFVNSVGYDYASRHPILTPVDRELLSGRRKGRFLSLESKIEKFPQVINAAEKPAILLSDPKQIKEPFVTFLALAKETRDSIAHHTEGKAPIWLSPHDWMTNADKAAASSLDCCKVFWHACYPRRDLPVYLEALDLETHKRQAKARLAYESQALGNDTNPKEAGL